MVAYRNLLLLHIYCYIEIVDRPKRRTLGDTSSVKHLHQGKTGVCGDVRFEALAQCINLSAVLLGGLARQVNLLLGECLDR